jgi:membrane protease YdiL (CAAX protease family)
MGVNMMEKSVLRNRVILFLAIIYTFLFVGWLLTVKLSEPHNQTAYTLFWALFSVFPVIATLLTRLITRDKSPWYLKPHFRRSWKTYLLAAFLSGGAIFLGAWLYYLIFPQDLDLSARNLVDRYAQYGAPDTIQSTSNTIFLVGAAFIFISPLVFPVHLFALGEEIGWRGYLLPLLLNLMSQRNAVLLHGLLWGVAHVPLIYFGFNYGLDYWGAPFTGMLMMILVCIVLGIWLSYVTMRSESIIPACILHGAANVIGEIPVFVSLLGVSPLIGPNPTGIVGMSGLIIGAVFWFWKLSNTPIPYPPDQEEYPAPGWVNL